MWPFRDRRYNEEQEQQAIHREFDRLVRTWRHKASWGIASEGVIGAIWDWKVGGYASVAVCFVPPGNNRALWTHRPGAVILATWR